MPVSGIPRRMLGTEAPNSGGTSDTWKYVLAGTLCAAALIIAGSVLFVIMCMRRRKGERTGRSVNAVPSSQLAPASPSTDKSSSAGADSLTYERLANATKGFSKESMLKHGHSGELYHGILEGGFHVVVKRVDLKSAKESCDVELGFFNKVLNDQFVPFLGHCGGKDGEEALMVYKFMPLGDLTNALHKKPELLKEGELQSLDWIARLKIASSVAEALCFLHHDCNPPLVHRFIRASSILIDDRFQVRLGSLSEICPQPAATTQSMLSRILKSSRSMDKELTAGPPATCSYDMYCFGKVLLELITGELGISCSDDAASSEWLQSTLSCINMDEKESVSKILDPTLLIGEDHLEEAWAVAIIAKTCLSSRPARRPTARCVLRALEDPVKVVRDDAPSNTARSRSSAPSDSWRVVFQRSWSQSTEASAARSGRHSFKSQGSGDQPLSVKRSPKELDDDFEV